MKQEKQFKEKCLSASYLFIVPVFYVCWLLFKNFFLSLLLKKFAYNSYKIYDLASSVLLIATLGVIAYLIWFGFVNRSEIKNEMKTKLNRDANYYFGLTFLIAASLSLPWCYFRDSFEAIDFLIFFLFYCAGFALLWKSDTTQRIGELLQEIKDLKGKVSTFAETNPLENEESAQAVEGEGIPSGTEGLTF